MDVSPRTFAIAAAAAAVVSVLAYAIGHRRGKGWEQRLNLARYRWKSRVLLVFAPSIEDEEFQIQMGQLASQSDGVRERDLIVVPILANGKGGAASRSDAAMLAKAHAIPRHAFRTVLIGKDGSVKRIDDQPLEIEQLFTLIDEMPMRRHEAALRTQSSVFR